MRVLPSVVVGIGSSGAYVVANLERLLYEVLGEAAINVFRLISIDTDNTRKEDEPPPGGKRGMSLSAYERDLGRAIYSLKRTLGDDFAWCPNDLKIQGQGAGNIRAGGRVMFFNKFSEIWDTIRSAAAEVREAARSPQSEQALVAELRRRGLNPPQGIVDPSGEVVYVVGTLAGGTGSGMCVDMGYAIQDAAPTAQRFGLFFLADRASLPVYVQNTWAALQDIEFFSRNRSHFRATWPRANGAVVTYQASDVPYSQIYLISQQNAHRQVALRYEPNYNAPLITMTALHLAADLLGLAEVRSRDLVNLNRQVPGAMSDVTRRVFLNLNLRAVSYPKYEISEAAACKVISDSTCASWLDREYHATAGGGRMALERNTIQSDGQACWSSGLANIWNGTRASVNLGEWADKLCDGHLSRPFDDLLHQFSAPVTDALFTKIQQQIPNRLVELKRMIRAGLGQRFEQNRNLTVAELYVVGIRGGIQRTLRYWDLLGIPAGHDEQGWAGVVRGLIENMLSRRSSLSVKALHSGREFARDQLQEIALRLQMHLMRSALDDALGWIDAYLAPWVKQLRATLESVQSSAITRYSTLLQQLSSDQPPILKLSRIKSDSGDRTEGFRTEITKLVATKPDPEVPLLRWNNTDDFDGLFAVPADQQVRNDNRPQEIFLQLKSIFQAKLLRALEGAGPVDIAQEIAAQNRLPTVATFLRDTAALSVATRAPLPTAGLPSLIVAKDAATGTLLNINLKSIDPGLPVMNPVGLPILDHMVIFHQEAAGAVPDELTDADHFRQEYNRSLQNDSPEYIDPLRSLRLKNEAAPS